MNEQQKQVRIERWNNYRGSAYRRWRVLSTFLTGFLIGLFYVLLISGWPSLGLDAEGHSNLVLIFSGILGGVIYSILVDEHIEMPRFIANKGDEFEAGLFGDILLGIAGAIVLEVIRQQLAPNTQEPAPVGIAAVGIIGGYGGRAILQFALQRVFKDINVLDVDRQKYLQTSLQKRLEGMDSLELIDQINQQINVGLAPAEIAELASAIKQSAVGSRLRIYNLAKEFRRAAKLAGETARIERTIPIFKALIESDPQQHSYYAELAFAYKDSDSPDLFQVIQYLDKAIALRGNQQRAETWNYELSRAITRIQEAYKALGSYDFDPAVHERIITDLLAVAEIYNLENILKEVSDQHVPVPILEWMQHNQAMLAAHPKAKVLIGQLDTLAGNESVGNESTDSQPASSQLVSSQPNNSQPAAPSPEPVPSSPIKPTSPSSPSILPQPPEKPVVISVTDSNIPQVGIALIKEFEGYAKKRPDGSAEAYPDVIHGWKVATIGYGTTSYPDGTKVKQGDIITRDKAETYLIKGLEHNYKKALEQIPTWAQMNTNQRAALYSFAYNLGAHFYKANNFESITLVCNSPARWTDKAWIEEQFVKYRNPGTSAEVGLRKRRLAEASLFCQPANVTSDKKAQNGRIAQQDPIILPTAILLTDLEPDAVRWVKSQLAHGGYYTEKIDGVVDEALMSAFKKFKAAFFLDKPDQIGSATVKVLAGLEEPTSETDIMLSQYFKLSEMIFSETAIRLKIDNSPSDPAVMENLKAVCQNILDPVRKHYGKSITPNSGYRSPTLNARVNGARNSQHVVGQAVDFVVPGVSIPEVCSWINQNLEFDQLIMEFYNPRTNGGWVHCSYKRNSGNRREFFFINK